MGKQESSEASPPVIENVGQLVDAVAIGKAGRVTVPRAQWPDLDGLILRCRKHYGTVPGDGALLRATAAVAEHQGTLLHRVNAMTLAEFNAALDEAFKAPEPPAEWWSVKDTVKLFGFGSPKELDAWLTEHDIPTRRPLTKAGKPDPHRREVEILAGMKALARDVAILDDPARMDRIRARVAKADIQKQLEQATLEAIGVRK